VDGGIANNFPLDVAVADGAPSILALNFDENLARSTEESLLAKMNHLFFVPITLKARETIERYKEQALIINIISETPIYQLKLSDADILSMLLEGYCEAWTHCKSYFSTSMQPRAAQVPVKVQADGTAGSSGPGKSIGYLWRQDPSQPLDKSELKRLEQPDDGVSALGE
jgi:hypothetical protein